MKLPFKTLTQRSLSATSPFALCCLIVLLLYCSAIGQTGELKPRIVPYHIDTGIHENLSQQEVTAYYQVISLDKGTPWMRIQIATAELGKGSYILLKAVKDKSVQHLNQKTLGIGQNNSAFFNGDQVTVELHVAPGDQGIFFRVEQLTAGVIPSLQMELVICGDTDDRVHSDDPAVGRLMQTNGLVAGTGWIIASEAVLTAGHVLAGTMIEFNVPSSNQNGSINHPDASDQYPITGTFTSGS
jgi:hypothetical protein